MEEVKDVELLGYRLFDMCILKTLFSIMICPDCKTQGLYLPRSIRTGTCVQVYINMAKCC